MDTIWLIGDTFADDTVSQYFMNIPEEDSYVHSHYDVKTFTSNEFRARHETAACRLRNSVAAALIEYVTLLPKMIEMVCEDDLIRSLAATSKLEAKLKYERILSWLFNEICKLLAGHNDSLLPVYHYIRK